MDVESTEHSIPPVQRRRPGFQPGHKRFGGRPAGARNVRTATAREIAARLKIDPVSWLLQAARTGQLKNADGSTTTISATDRIQAMKNVLPFIHARRSSLHVSGHVESDVRVAKLDLVRIMMDPKLAEAAETLSIAMSEQETGIPAK
jgi:hypothetical protein